MNGKKINTTQLVALLATVLVLLGIEVSPEDQVKIVVGIQAVSNVITMVLRIWFTNKPEVEQ